MGKDGKEGTMRGKRGCRGEIVEIKGKGEPMSGERRRRKIGGQKEEEKGDDEGKG